MQAGHLFFSHSNSLRMVELRYVHGKDLKEEFFERWLHDFPDPYQQRYLKNVPYGWVVKRGRLLMRLDDGEITFPSTIAAAPDQGRAKLRPSSEDEE